MLQKTATESVPTKLGPIISNGGGTVTVTAFLKVQ